MNTMTNQNLFFRLGLLIALPALLLFGACDSTGANDDDHDDHNDHPDEHLARVEIQARDGTGETLAVWTDEDNAWNVDALPALEEGGDYAAWTVRMFTEGGDEIALEEGGALEARYAVDAEAPQDVIYFDASGVVEVDGAEEELFHGDHIHVYPQNAGTTRIRFIRWHDNHGDGDTSFIDLTVEAADEGNGA